LIRKQWKEGRQEKKKKRIGVAAEKAEYSLFFFDAVATLLSKEKKTPLQQSREKAHTHMKVFSSRHTTRHFRQNKQTVVFVKTHESSPCMI
jgi:hypothetical protein